MAPTTECELKKQKKEQEIRHFFTDSCPKAETGQSQPWIICYNKIFKNSLYRGLFFFSSIQDQLTLIYGKETTKYRRINPYICRVYISINHFKSFCGKQMLRKHQSVRQDSRREVPVTHTHSASKAFHQNVQICLRFQ